MLPEVREDRASIVVPLAEGNEPDECGCNWHMSVFGGDAVACARAIQGVVADAQALYPRSPEPLTAGDRGAQSLSGSDREIAKVFFSYSHDDETYRDQLEKHPAMLRHQGLIESLHDRRITAGSRLDAVIDAQLESADIVLQLVSSSFLASEYCYSIEMKRAMDRHVSGNAVVVPVIVRPCDWRAAPFGELLAVPKDGKAVTQWPNLDEAYADVARQIRSLVQLRDGRAPPRSPVPASVSDVSQVTSLPRSSNLRLRKEFTERDRDAFLLETFEYLARFFEGSLLLLCQ